MSKTLQNKDLAAPEGITKSGLLAWKTIMNFLNKHDMGYTGGCKAFYTGLEAQKYHEYKFQDAVLVLHYDGGDLRYCFNRDWETASLCDEMQECLSNEGFYSEQLNGWSCAIYRK